MSSIYFAKNGQWVRDQVGITPPPPPPPPTSTKFGMSVYVNGQTDAQAFSSLETQFDNIPVIREYFSNNATLPSSYTSYPLFQAAYNNGCKIWVISVKWGAMTDTAGILSGSHNQEMQNFFTSLPNDVLVYFCWYHEADNDGLSSSQQTTYRAVWDYLAPIVRGYGHKTTLITTKFVLNNDPTATEWRKYYSAGAVDVIGFDAYNTGNKANPKKYTPASTIMGPIITLAQQEGKPWGIGETGSPIIPADTDGSQRAQWITDCCNMIATNNGAYYCYWNRVSLNGTTDYRIQTSDTIGTNAYKVYLNS